MRYIYSTSGAEGSFFSAVRCYNWGPSPTLPPPLGTDPNKFRKVARAYFRRFTTAGEKAAGEYLES